MDTGESGPRFLSDGKILAGDSMNRLPNHCCARLLALLTVFSAGRRLAPSERDTLAATPPIGSNSSRKFAGDVSGDLIKSMADAMAS